jgi:hypothetical protein
MLPKAATPISLRKYAADPVVKCLPSGMNVFDVGGSRNLEA